MDLYKQFLSGNTATEHIGNDSTFTVTPVNKTQLEFCPLSKFNELLGKPNEGIHSIRFFNTAIIDFIIALFFALTLTWITGRINSQGKPKYKQIPLVLSTILILIIGEILHIIFGVKTNTLAYFGINCDRS